MVKMRYMICSKCGNTIAETDGSFDIWDTSWFCKSCETRWFSSDGWQEVGNLLIPSRVPVYLKKINKMNPEMNILARNTLLTILKQKGMQIPELEEVIEKSYEWYCDRIDKIESDKKRVCERKRRAWGSYDYLEHTQSPYSAGKEKEIT